MSKEYRARQTVKEAINSVCSVSLFYELAETKDPYWRTSYDFYVMHQYTYTDLLSEKQRAWLTKIINGLLREARRNI